VNENSDSIHMRKERKSDQEKFVFIHADVAFKLESIKVLGFLFLFYSFTYPSKT